MQGGGEIAVKAGLGTGEASVHSMECGVQVIGRLWVPEANQAIAAPSGKVSLVEDDVRQVVAAGAVPYLMGGAVKSLAAGGLQPGCGGHLGLGRAQPAADLVRDCCPGLLVGVADYGQRVFRTAQVKQDVGLLAAGERQQAHVPGFPGGSGGALEMRPGPGQP